MQYFESGFFCLAYFQDHPYSISFALRFCVFCFRDKFSGRPRTLCIDWAVFDLLTILLPLFAEYWASGPLCPALFSEHTHTHTS